jgi:hypothetical protein
VATFDTTYASKNVNSNSAANATAISRPANDSAWTARHLLTIRAITSPNSPPAICAPKIWQDSDTAHPAAEKHCDGYSFHYGGLAIQDLADPRMLLNLARQRGIGVELPLV